MTDSVVVFKWRTNRIEVTLNQDVTVDTYTSQIRRGRRPTSPLIATWNVSVKDDGKKRTLILHLSVAESSTEAVVNGTAGWMDIKRVSGGDELPVFDNPLSVVFQDQVTA